MHRRLADAEPHREHRRALERAADRLRHGAALIDFARIDEPTPARDDRFVALHPRRLVRAAGPDEHHRARRQLQHALRRARGSIREPDADALSRDVHAGDISIEIVAEQPAKARELRRVGGDAMFP